jgi:hypothetical protein
MHRWLNCAVASVTVFTQARFNCVRPSVFPLRVTVPVWGFGRYSYRFISPPSGGESPFGPAVRLLSRRGFFLQGDAWQAYQEALAGLGVVGVGSVVSQVGSSNQKTPVGELLHTKILRTAPSCSLPTTGCPCRQSTSGARNEDSNDSPGRHPGVDCNSSVSR